MLLCGGGVSSVERGPRAAGLWTVCLAQQTFALQHSTLASPTSIKVQTPDVTSERADQESSPPRTSGQTTRDEGVYNLTNKKPSQSHVLWASPRLNSEVKFRYKGVCPQVVDYVAVRMWIIFSWQLRWNDFWIMFIQLYVLAVQTKIKYALPLFQIFCVCLKIAFSLLILLRCSFDRSMNIHNVFLPVNCDFPLSSGNMTCTIYGAAI